MPEALVATYKGFGLDLPLSNTDDRWVLPIPATIVVNAAGVIVLSHVDLDYTKRLEPSNAIAAMRNAYRLHEPVYVMTAIIFSTGR